jgi:secreted PhoX family phosphatase
MIEESQFDRRTFLRRGATPWGTWITGEETTEAGHGWSFDVGAQNGDPTPRLPGSIALSRRSRASSKRVGADRRSGSEGNVVRQSGDSAGGAKFRRLEGCWWGDTKGYFLSTNGGPVSEGQVFEYDPFNERLKLIYASPNANDLDNPDNITVTPLHREPDCDRRKDGCTG